MCSPIDVVIVGASEREAVSVSEVKDTQELRIAERTKGYVLSAPPKGITIYTIAVYCTYVRTVIA